MKWLVVAAILAYVGLRVYVYLRPKSAIGRAFQRRYVLRTDAHAMSRKEVLLSSLSFLAFGLAGVGLFVGVGWGTSELQWQIFNARPIVVLAKAGLFVGGMALVTSVFLIGVGLFHQGD
jgi:hypothetical protein